MEFHGKYIRAETCWRHFRCFTQQFLLFLGISSAHQQAFEVVFLVVSEVVKFKSFQLFDNFESTQQVLSLTLTNKYQSQLETPLTHFDVAEVSPFYSFAVKTWLNVYCIVRECALLSSTRSLNVFQCLTHACAVFVVNHCLVSFLKILFHEIIWI